MLRTVYSLLVTAVLLGLPIAAYAECAEGGYYSSSNEGDVYLVATDGGGDGLYDCDTNEVNWVIFPDAD